MVKHVYEVLENGKTSWKRNIGCYKIKWKIIVKVIKEKTKKKEHGIRIWANCGIGSRETWAVFRAVTLSSVGAVGAPGLPSKFLFFCWYYEQLSPLRSTELGTGEEKRIGTEHYKCRKMDEGRVHNGRAGLWPLWATAGYCHFLSLWLLPTSPSCFKDSVRRAQVGILNISSVLTLSSASLRLG